MFAILVGGYQNFKSIKNGTLADKIHSEPVGFLRLDFFRRVKALYKMVVLRSAKFPIKFFGVHHLLACKFRVTIFAAEEFLLCLFAFSYVIGYRTQRRLRSN
ncbi:MAG: hypothetical protein BHW43_07940 [Phascolarctobacterium succinatutens]|uniref:Uncharacterized protein n=1 Tax=Phascolarctobacterium succinatutens TaxID=626940 RepID=A0A1Q6R3U2_9FIRM|nr:MAG: hypothetical protein BHW43_07940 [Phascolarctobacterium succinatutens]